MIFFNNKNCDLSFTPNTCNYDISRKSNARFLGVISRYVGILYPSSLVKIFSIVLSNPVQTIVPLFGAGSIEKLFTEQNKAITSLAPGFNRNLYKNGINLCHTKRFFAENGVLTVHSIILTNILLFMSKYYNYNQYLPSSVSNIISPAAPKPDIIINNDHIDWLSDHTTGRLRNAISFKGPLFSTHYMN